MSEHYSEQHEQNTLASILLDNDQWHTISPIVNAESFYLERHRLIWRAFEAVRADGRPLDLEIVAQKLLDQGRLEQVGGVAYLVGLQSETLVSVYGDHYAGVVADKAAMRNLVKAGSRILQLARDANASPVEVFTQASSLLGEAAPDTGHQNATQPLMSDWRALYATNVDKRTNPSSRVISTGLADVDRAIPSLDPGQLIILAARPGMGKSALALQMALHNAKRGLNVLMFSLEMMREELAGRAVCQEARVNYTRFNSGQLSQEELNRIEYAAARVTGRLEVNDRRGLNVDQLAAEAHRYHRTTPVDFLIVDYLQRLTERNGKKGESNRVQEVGYMAQVLKNLAGQLGVPVLCLSQLSRNVEARMDKRPMLADLRESGEIEQEADVVMFPYRAGYYDEKAGDEAELIIPKRRNGAAGTIDISWQGEHVRYENTTRTSHKNWTGGN